MRGTVETIITTESTTIFKQFIEKILTLCPKHVSFIALGLVTQGDVQILFVYQRQYKCFLVYCGIPLSR